MSGGRPTSYTEEIGRRICEQIIDGKGMVEICASSDDFPTDRCVYQWINRYEEFRQMYFEAKAICAERMAEDLLAIADDGRNDWMERQNGDGYIVDHEHVGRSKLRVDTRKWLMCHLAPMRFGNVLKNEHSGPGGGPIPIEKVTRTIIDPKDDDTSD